MAGGYFRLEICKESPFKHIAPGGGSADNECSLSQCAKLRRLHLKNIYREVLQVVAAKFYVHFLPISSYRQIAELAVAP